MVDSRRNIPFPFPAVVATPASMQLRRAATASQASATTVLHAVYRRAVNAAEVSVERVRAERPVAASERSTGRVLIALTTAA